MSKQRRTSDMAPSFCPSLSWTRKHTGGSEGPGRGHRLPGNALKAFILSFDQTMRTFQTLTQGKKSLFFPGPEPWCQAGARGWEGQGEGDSRVGDRGSSDPAGKSGPWTHTLPSFSPPQDLCASGSISICLFSLGQDRRETDE